MSPSSPAATRTGSALPKKGRKEKKPKQLTILHAGLAVVLLMTRPGLWLPCLPGVSQVHLEPVPGCILFKSGAAGNKLGTQVLAANTTQKKLVLLSHTSK